MDWHYAENGQQLGPITSCARTCAVSDLAIFGDAAICADCKRGVI